MKTLSSLTIIDDKNVRGVIAPAKALPKKLLGDVIDFIELSSAAAIKETESRIREADRAHSWIPLREVVRRAKRVK